MIRRRRHVAALGLGFLLLVTGLTLGQPSPAQADDFCAFQDRTPPTITGFSPATVVLGVKSRPVQFSVQAQDQCGISGWSIGTPKRPLFFVYKDSSTDILVPHRNRYAGTAAADIFAHDQAYNMQTRRSTFRLLRHARWQKADIGPESVKKGARLTITGALQRADWDKDAYVRYGAKSQRTTVEFKARGSDRWIAVKNVKFSGTGRMSTRVKVEREIARDGWYRLRFAGTRESSPAVSAPDYIDVR